MSVRKYREYSDFCEKARANNRKRTLYDEQTFNNQIVSHDYLDFTNNDYLNLRKDPRLLEAAYEYGREYGVGSGVSRLLNFHLPIYQEFEREIAQSKKKEAALIIGSGYQTNATVLSALLNKRVLQKEPIVFCDRLNHSSIHHGCILANIKQIRYNHCDLNHLEYLLKQAGPGPKFIITESLFSMDGDTTDLHHLARLGKKYDTFIYLDEAHATGVFGYGLTEALSSEELESFDVIMGTFSKALGSFGSYVATSNQIKDYLINSCTGLIYSTSLPPMIIGAARKAWQIIGSNDMRQKAKILLDNVSFLRQELEKNDWHVINGPSQIVSIMNQATSNRNKDDLEAGWILRIAEQLRAQGILVAPIRPPTVPSSRLRINLTLKHNQEDIRILVKALMKLVKVASFS